MREHSAGTVGLVHYSLTDHLGSTSVTLNSIGLEIAELRYKPWGENRYTTDATPPAVSVQGS